MTLAVRLYQQSTPPHGEGVFTADPIQAGTAILTFTGPLLVHEQTHDLLRCLQVDEHTYMGPSGGLDDYVNHCCAPNAGFTHGSLTLFALRNIAPGEQIFWDYSTAMDEPGWGFACACGAATCRGWVGGFRSLSEAERERLRPISLAYLRGA